jgi:hypothetical protein
MVVTGATIKLLTIKNINELSNASISNQRTNDINYLLKLFGHYGQDTLNNMLKCVNSILLEA